MPVKFGQVLARVDLLLDAVLAAAGTLYQVERAATRAALSLIPASMLRLV